MRFSFIIPAHNEAASLPGTLAALLAAERSIGGRHETIVVDDGSTDDTGAVARERGAAVLHIDRRQIAAARNAGAAAAAGDTLLFIDADTIVNADAIREAAFALSHGATYGGAPIRFDDPCPAWARAILPFVAPIHRATGLVPGCFFAVRRPLFARVGGFDETVFAGEEALLARALARAGGRHYLGRTPVVTSGRKLRDYTGRQILGVTMRLAVQGRRGVQSREGLDLWYRQRVSPAAERPAPPSS